MKTVLGGINLPDISKRSLEQGTETAFKVLGEVTKRISAGQNIISFCIGQPDFNTPQNIKDAAIKAIINNKSGYTPSAGVPEIKEAVANHLSKTRNVYFSAEDIVIDNGAKPFIQYAIKIATDAGEGHEVIYPNPGFPIYESQIRSSGAVPIPIPLVEKNNFAFDLDILKSSISKKTKMIIVSSPQNPTGGVLNDEDLEELAKLAIDNNLWVYSDEPYSGLVYDGDFKSISSLPGMLERTIVVDGASKSYAMTGWRIGYAANKKLAPYLANWVTNTNSCANHISQYALLEALTGPQDVAEMMAASFKERRDLMVGLLNDVDGINCLMPGGAFYAYPNVTKACDKLGIVGSEEFRKLLLDKGVAVLADIHFGPKNPGQTEEYIRLSYATSKQGIIDGCKIIKNVVEGK